MEMLLILEYLLPLLLVAAAVVGLSFLKAALLRLSAQLSRKAESRKA